MRKKPKAGKPAAGKKPAAKPRAPAQPEAVRGVGHGCTNPANLSGFGRRKVPC